MKTKHFAAKSESKSILFSITKEDLVIEVFRAGGRGGQKQNKTSSGVRIKHPASGAAAESREERSQLQNKRNAFRRLVNSKKFRNWIRLEAARRVGWIAEIEENVQHAMRPEFLRVEGWDPRAERWVPLTGEAE